MPRIGWKVMLLGGSQNRSHGVLFWVWFTFRVKQARAPWIKGGWRWSKREWTLCVCLSCTGCVWDGRLLIVYISHTTVIRVGAQNEDFSMVHKFTLVPSYDQHASQCFKTRHWIKDNTFLAHGQNRKILAHTDPTRLLWSAGPKLRANADAHKHTLGVGVLPLLVSASSSCRICDFDAAAGSLKQHMERSLWFQHEATVNSDEWEPTQAIYEVADSLMTQI